MKRHIHTSFFLFAIVALLVAGCSKSSDNSANPNTPTSSSAVTISFSDSYGALAAVTAVTYSTVAGMVIPVEVNTPVAAFHVSQGSSTLIDAGTVTLNGKTLSKQSNNGYVYTSVADPVSYGTLTWTVSGANGIPAINYSDDRPMPDFSGYSNLPSSITKSAGLTISLAGTISNADSVWVVIIGSSGSPLIKKAGGNPSDVVISSSELSGLPSGTGILEIVPWNYKSEDFNSKRFYFVNEKAFVKNGVTIN
jgi:hypothetical protein